MRSWFSVVRLRMTALSFDNDDVGSVFVFDVDKHGVVTPFDCSLSSLPQASAETNNKVLASGTRSNQKDSAIDVGRAQRRAQGDGLNKDIMVARPTRT